MGRLLPISEILYKDFMWFRVQPVTCRSWLGRSYFLAQPRTGKFGQNTTFEFQLQG